MNVICAEDKIIFNVNMLYDSQKDIWYPRNILLIYYKRLYGYNDMLISFEFTICISEHIFIICAICGQYVR